MKTLDDLTPEILAKIPAYKERCTKDLYSGVEAANFNKKRSTEYVEKVYEIAGYSKPVVVFAEDPLHYKERFLKLKNQEVENLVKEYYNEKNKEDVDQQKVDELDAKLEAVLNSDIEVDESINVVSQYLFLCSSYHRVYLTWYKFIQDEFNIEHKNKETLDYLYENANNNILRCYFTEEYVLVLKMPKRIRRNDNGFHSTTKAAIEWDNYKMYYVNGRKLPEDLFLKTLNKELTFKEFTKLDNEDIKANVITMIRENDGNEGLMKFLDAQVVSEREIAHSSGHVEVAKLWKTKEKFEFLADIDGNMNQPYAWLELTCPTSGSIYLIDTSAHFTDALDACKFHRPQSIPAEMKYDFEQFNN